MLQAVTFMQIYDNAMITAGLIDSARSMVGRLNALLPKLLINRSSTTMTKIEQETSPSHKENDPELESKKI